MMCQKNYGSTVRRASSQLDLTSVNQYLKEDHDGSSNNNGKHVHDTNNNNNIVVMVKEAMADYPTYYANLVVWYKSGGDTKDKSSKQPVDDVGSNEGDLTSSRFSNFSIDDNDGNDDDAGVVNNATPNINNSEFHDTITKLVADLAISELEDIGFDARFLEAESNVISHRESAAREKQQQKDRTNGGGDDESALFPQEQGEKKIRMTDEIAERGGG